MFKLVIANNTGGGGELVPVGAGCAVAKPQGVTRLGIEFYIE